MLLDLPQWLLYLTAAILGSILGSFSNVCICRMPRGESVAWPPSHCPACNRRLAFWENVPIASSLFLRGRCRTCRAKISLQYPLVEALCAALSVLAWWHFQEPLHYLVYLCLLIIPLVILSVIDLFHYIIPDSISIPGIIVGFVVRVLLEGRSDYVAAMIDSTAGILVGGGALYLVAVGYEKLKKQEGMGGGDVKLIAMLGAFFGWKAVLLILMLSSFLGSIIGLLMVLILRKDLKFAIPFGPFISIAGLIYLFSGEKILHWYASLFS